jgi:hypothetical protein
MCLNVLLCYVTGLRKTVVKLLILAFSDTLTQAQVVFTITTSYVPEHSSGKANWHFTLMKRHDWRLHSRIIQTGCGAHRSYYPMGTERSFPGG